MIDLKQKGTPNAITVNGVPFFINTDYRLWLDFPERIDKALHYEMSYYEELFTTTIPPLTEETLRQLQAFYYQPSELPRTKNGTECIDYDIDADYIFAAFYQVYRIDLTEANLHWHKFIVLLNCLPSETLISQIISYRLYEGDDKEYNNLKYEWSLPKKYTQEEKAQIDDFNKMFG